ncbi:transglutaminase domain-containing protein [Microbacterium koreense]|uniref:Transglutaminase domain-containing protein n=1 Tax=Microbacterium koreense TaxID=323761 RepID=A0ABW2ZMV4_9MICO
MTANDRAPSAWTRGLAPRVHAGSTFALVIVVIAAAAAWPIYRTSAFVLLVAVSVSLATVVAFAARAFAWSGWIVCGVLTGVVLVTGIPLAVPSRMGDAGDLLRGWGEVAAGVVLGWKDLLTVELPVGSYRNLLVPALIVFLVGTSAVLLLSWRAGRRAYLAVPVALSMVSFGLVFGRADVSAPWTVGSITLYAPVETVLGISGLLATLLWLSWRTHDERARALRRAADSSGVRVARRISPTDRHRVMLGLAMIAGCALVAVVVVPFVARGMDRDVLRSAVGPQIDLSAQVSPLTEHRGMFDDARASEVLFTISGEELPARVRLATLTDYDGEVFRTGEGAGAFLRLPSAIDPGTGRTIDAHIEVSDLGGVWMPTVGRLHRVEFDGQRAAELADGFYYSTDADAGIQIAGGGLTDGDAYVIHAVESAVPELTTVTAPGAEAIEDAPESVRTWIERHLEGVDGTALDGLVTLLRERGYLSHALTVPETDTPEWVQALDGYEFQPSASGHSLGRIDAMFTRLLEREDDPRAAASGNYVAAVGDDEQFAVAVAVIARELGFPARVVVGARLVADDDTLAVCDAGICRAGDVTAWTEVLSSDGQWIPIDVTPQHTRSPSMEFTEQRDPEVVTDVRPDLVEEVVPPAPEQQDALVDDGDQAGGSIDLTWLWPALRGTAAGLLILLLAVGPFLAVVIAKALRRRARRAATMPEARIAGGWEEFLDAATDAGHTLPRAATREEIARAVASPGAHHLAHGADRAVFAHGLGLDEADARAYWDAVEAERRALVPKDALWRRTATAVSLRSIIRPLAPESGPLPSSTERGRRSAPHEPRPTT